MGKMWAGVTDGVTDSLADDFNSSIAFDSRMARQDILGSMAHAAMLAETGILSREEGELLIAGLEKIQNDLESGALSIDPKAEDIHMFIEAVLTERLGDVGKKLHTARSRNDQVALDLRLYLREEIDAIRQKIERLIKTVIDKAELYQAAIMPGYTHLQRAQPVTFGHHLLAYAEMFMRDRARLTDCRKRLNICPIGCCALAGTTYPTDRKSEADALGFDGVCRNSMDGVSDRDFVAELLFDLSLVMMHLSRFCEEIVLWSSWEFRFVELSDAFTTGSSIMPQKKNPDMAELVRGKCGRVYGDLMALLTTLKALPLAYNKDLQEDKESVFDACDTAKKCLDIFEAMIASLSARTDNMKKAAQTGFIGATDLADYLVKKGMPFRAAYKIAGQIVARCMKAGLGLDSFPLEAYREFSDLFEEDVYKAVDLTACVERRISEGSTSVSSVQKQIRVLREELGL